MKSAIVTLGVLLLGFNAVVSAADNKSDADTKSAEQRLEDAHKRLEQAAREVAELSTKVSKDHMPDNMIFLNRNPNRAMLGIGIGGDDEKKIDEGVSIVSVSPGGPAAGAGLKTGDVIVELNGKSLKRDKEDSPHEKLLEAMGKLSPGDEVTLRYLRDGKSSIAKVKVEKLPQLARREIRMRTMPGGPGGPEHFNFDHDDFNFDFDMPHVIGLMRHGSFGDMELVPLTPKLAQYFGTDKGLLIVRAPEGKDVKLEDGDVLIDIDGRVPTNPGHAFRILGSYQPGEKVTLNVYRQKKKTAVSIVVPEHEEHGPRPPLPPRAPREPRPTIAPLPPIAPAPTQPPV